MLFLGTFVFNKKDQLREKWFINAFSMYHLREIKPKLTQMITLNTWYVVPLVKYNSFVEK